MKILFLLYFLFFVNILFSQNKYFLFNGSDYEIELSINNKTKIFTLIDTIGYLQCYHKGHIIENKLIFDTCYFQFFDMKSALAVPNKEFENKNSFLYMIYFNSPNIIKFFKSRNEICIDNSIFYKNNS
ncbi:MAG: hypothetical protein ACOCWB_01885, partial [Bacteroidota bacterium]